MQRRIFPSILLYSFGLALALSLVFNGFLLYQQIRPQSPCPEVPGSASVFEDAGYQRQLSDCQRANQQKDSLIHQLEQAPNGLSAPTATAHHTASK